MPSKPPARWPRPAFGVAVLLAGLTAGGVVAGNNEPLQAASEVAHGGGEQGGTADAPDFVPPADSVLLWVFLSDHDWEDRAARGALEGTGARVRSWSRWLNAYSVAAPPRASPLLRELPFVQDVRAVGRVVAPQGTSSLQTRADSSYGELGPILDALQIPTAHELGFQGSGIRIGILDGLFLPTHPTLQGRGPAAVWDFVEGDNSVVPGPTDPPETASHGTALWSLLSADLPEVLRGSSPGAEILLARVRGPGELSLVDEDRWVAGLEWLESQGARLVLSGVSFRTLADSAYSIEDLDGDRTPATRAADEAARRGVLVVTPVGNGGPALESLGAPADGDSVLSVGAVSLQGGLVDFSAVGPTADGRAKPEVLAPGAGIPAASAGGSGALAPVDGTEFAAALVAGAAALFVEAYPERGPMELSEALVASASQEPVPFRGVPRVASAILFPDGIQSTPLTEVDSEGRVTNLAPQFRWSVPTLHPLGLPVTFFLEVATDSLFRAGVVTDSVVGTFARRLQAPLPPRTRVFWRVRARSVQGVTRASPARGPLEVPSWVSLDVLNDPGGTQLDDPRPEFRWTPVPIAEPAGPLRYDVEVLSDRDGAIVQRIPDLEATQVRLAEPLPFNQPFRWRVIARSRVEAADTVTSAGPFVITGVEQPPVTFLYQNFPNPFPDLDSGVWSTRIWFDLAHSADVRLALYDTRGRLVRRLIPAPGCGPVTLPAGLYGREPGPLEEPCVELQWDGRDDEGRQVDPGVYLLRLRAGGVVKVRRVVFWPGARRDAAAPPAGFWVRPASGIKFHILRAGAWSREFLGLHPAVR